ncbi:MAG: rod shape-determining protein MreC [Acidimicrobiaceae bacterium]|nr:rod shape-determining protein MreC [Acidimicrobiaceae bacterium]
MAKLFERPRITLFILVLASASLITLNYRGGSRFSFVSVKAAVRDVITPVRSTLNSAFSPVGNVITGAFDYGSLKAENRKLKSQIYGAEMVKLAAGDAQRQLNQLLKLDNIQFAQGIASVPAQVISMTPSNLQLSFEIDKGQSVGIRLGMVVVGGSGLAGRIVAVGSTTSTVLMVSDPNFAAGVRFGSGGNIALLNGQGMNEPLKVNLVDPGAPIRVGQVLVTSGLQGEIFPPGIPIAKVTAIANPLGALQESVKAVPVVDYAGLQYVRVLKWQPPS